MKYNRDELLNELKEYVAEITFRKVDGTMRTMKCTLMPNMLPSNYNSTYMDEMHKRKENFNVIAAWDMTARAWKSFRVENVELVQILDNF